MTVQIPNGIFFVFQGHTVFPQFKASFLYPHYLLLWSLHPGLILSVCILILCPYTESLHSARTPKSKSVCLVVAYSPISVGAIQ